MQVRCQNLHQSLIDDKDSFHWKAYVAHQSQPQGPPLKSHGPKLNTTNDNTDQDERRDIRRQLPSLKIDENEMETMKLRLNDTHHGAMTPWCFNILTQQELLRELQKFQNSHKP